MKVYKIRHKKTGLFSTGGMRPKWTHQGKVWQRLNYVHSHITQLASDYTPADVYNDAEIVEAEITEILVPLEPANKHLIEKTEAEIEYYKEHSEKHPDDTFYSRYLEMYRGRRALMK